MVARILVISDTHLRADTVDRLPAQVWDEAKNADLILHAGDLAYADGNGLRWDSYGRLGERLFAAVPTGEYPCLLR